MDDGESCVASDCGPLEADGDILGSKNIGSYLGRWCLSVFFLCPEGPTTSKLMKKKGFPKRPGFLSSQRPRFQVAIVFPLFPGSLIGFCAPSKAFSAPRGGWSSYVEKTWAFQAFRSSSLD